MAAYDKNDIQRRMTGALEALKHDLGGLRTGRASTALLDPIQVEVYGANMPISQVATISAPEPRLLSVQVWDKGNVNAVEKAIRAAGLGINPISDGQMIRLPERPHVGHALRGGHQQQDAEEHEHPWKRQIAPLQHERDQNHGNQEQRARGDGV